jgi:NCAIR mutase (PurE)-related protein
VNLTRLRELLLRLKAGEVETEAVVEEIRRLPFESLPGLATLDSHRELRTGMAEVVFGEGKRAEDIATILSRLSENGEGALATRVDADKAQLVLQKVARAEYHHRARVLLVKPATPKKPAGRGAIAIVCAGTSDLPVADEASLTLEFLGHRAQTVTDVGIAGLQRILSVTEELRSAEVVIVIAGMEGALPAVVSSLVHRPIIAVPTSVGYGVGVGGFVAMQTMLSSCSPGVTVVNIDNGFGAAVAAARINHG